MYINKHTHTITKRNKQCCINNKCSVVWITKQRFEENVNGDTHEWIVAQYIFQSRNIKVEILIGMCSFLLNNSVHSCTSGRKEVLENIRSITFTKNYFYWRSTSLAVFTVFFWWSLRDLVVKSAFYLLQWWFLKAFCEWIKND